MNNIKFNDWQEMALKKDTEAIIKKLNSQEPIVFSLCWEIVLAVGAIIVDHLFDTSEICIYVWIFCASLAIIPPLLIIIVKTTKWIIAIKRAKSGIYSTRNFIDTFDNQICYWVMMCNSYSRILASLPSNQIAERVFLYQEGCYYNNKSIQTLYGMKPVVDKIFSNDSKKVLENNMVATYRLLNILEMIKQHQTNLDMSIEDISSNDLIAKQKQINIAFRDKLVPFIIDINTLFGTQFNWDQ